MSGNEGSTGRRATRHAATRSEILTAAWQLARDEGLVGFAMRDLGARVGMTAQSIYSYFGSKHEIYDAMFRQGFEAFDAWMAPLTAGLETGPALTKAERLTTARRAAHAFFEFCTADPVRFQLLFQRTIPGFEPSPASYAVSLASYARAVDGLAAVGFDTPESVDIWTAVCTGLASQQIANDPGGDRWQRLVDPTVDLLFAHLGAAPRKDSR